MKTGRLWSRSTLFAVLMLLAAACVPLAPPGSGTESAKPTPGQAATSAQSSPEWDRLVAAAQKEGELVLLGPANQDLRSALNDTFTKQYGVNVNFFGGSTELFAKLMAERAAGQYTADVVLNGAPSLLPIVDEAFDPVRPALLLPEATDQSKWLNGHMWWSDKDDQKLLRLSLVVFGYAVVNPSTVDPASIKSWDDLMDPRFTGKIVSPVVTRPGPGAGTASYLWIRLGEEKFRRLYVDQKITYMDDARQAAEAVARGTYPVGLGVDSSAIEPLKRQGIKLEPVSPAPGALTSAWGVLAIVNKAPHPNAAQLFANWAASREGGEVINRALDAYSPRLDVSNDWALPYVRPNPGLDYVDSHSYKFLTEDRAKADAGVRSVIR
jgi:iron(III) transport system substrate-binding protein